MDGDLDDTVIGPARRLTHETLTRDDDTIIRPQAEDREHADLPAQISLTDDSLQRARHYRFSVNGREAIELDRPAFIGRKPSTPRVAIFASSWLVSVPSSDGEVSATHLELRQRASVVIATDLKSTNGTRVTVPGGKTVRLRQGESIVVTPGAILEIGDGNLVEILSIARDEPHERREELL